MNPRLVCLELHSAYLDIKTDDRSDSRERDRERDVNKNKKKTI